MTKTSLTHAATGGWTRLTFLWEPKLIVLSLRGWSIRILHRRGKAERQTSSPYRPEAWSGMHSESMFAGQCPVRGMFSAVSTRFVQDYGAMMGHWHWFLPRNLVIAATMFWTSIFMDEMFLTSKEHRVPKRRSEELPGDIRRPKHFLNSFTLHSLIWDIEKLRFPAPDPDSSRSTVIQVSGLTLRDVVNNKRYQAAKCCHFFSDNIPLSSYIIDLPNWGYWGWGWLWFIDIKLDSKPLVTARSAPEMRPAFPCCPPAPGRETDNLWPFGIRGLRENRSSFDVTWDHPPR